MSILREGIFRGPEFRADGILSQSLAQHFIDVLHKYEDRTVLVQEVDGVEVCVTYAQLLQQSKSVAALLRRHGIGCADTVISSCDNKLQYLPILLGSLFVGAAFAPVITDFTTCDMAHMIGVVQPQLVIVDVPAEQQVREALDKDVNNKVVVITMQAVVENMQQSRNDEDFQPAVIKDPDTHVFLIFASSGTTGKPKAVEHSHTGFIRFLSIFHMLPKETDKQLVFINIFSPGWIVGNLYCLQALTYGYKIVLLLKFTVEKFLQYIQQYRVTSTYIVPPRMLTISQFPSTADYDLSSLRTIMIGGTTIVPPLKRLVEEKLRAKLTCCYGLSEILLLNPAYEVMDKPLTVGTLAAGVEAKVVDQDTGSILPAGSTGELCFKSAVRFIGYRGNRQATEAMFDTDGFLNTGDLGYFDEQGYLYVVDRIKDIYKYNAIHVAPLDLEEVLLQNPDVMEVAVIGLYHAFDVSHATAFVVLRPGASVTEKELVDSVKSQLPSYKWLYGGVHFLSSLPKSSIGKIKKNELRKQYEKITIN